jgi:hypothetical protein
MAGGVGHVVDLADDPVRVDEERAPPREVAVLLVRALQDAVGLADGAVLVGQQPVREALCVGELLVVGRRVERRPDDDRIVRLELRASITEAPALDRSTGRGRLRVPPQHDPTTGQVGRREVLPVLVGEGEGRRGRAFTEHGGTLASGAVPVLDERGAATPARFHVV